MDIVKFFLDVEKNDMQNLLTNPRARYTKKKENLMSAWIRASKKMWKEQGRSLTEEEKIKVIKEAKSAYNREIRSNKQSMAFNKVASVTL
jgi:ABC-type microcin C transport system duplicated ATPase subunit YejF